MNLILIKLKIYFVFVKKNKKTNIPINPNLKVTKKLAKSLISSKNMLFSN